jgi:broad specificity phosphatase PhoE
MPTVLLVRHAQASYGASDYDVLSSLGREQVAALVAGLERRGTVADRVECGALRRQRETAEPCATAAGCELVVDERWNEYDDADVLHHHSSSTARLARDPVDGTPPLSSREFQTVVNEGLRGWVAAGSSSACREPWPDFVATRTAALDDLTAGLGKGETVIVVSSSGVISALAVAVLGLPPDALIAFNHVSVNTGITKLVVGRGGTSLVSFNEHVHLEEAGSASITYR